MHLSLIQYSSLANTVVVLFYDKDGERKHIEFSASDLVGEGQDYIVDLNPGNVIFVVPQNYNAQSNPPSGFVFSWKITALEAKQANIGTEFNISERL